MKTGWADVGLPGLKKIGRDRGKVMGRGSYTSSDWSKLKKSSSISEASTADQIFTKRAMEDRFNPRFIQMREARDSEDHPDSTPIIIGLDTTGSMGYLSEEIAKNSLHETMMKLYSTKPVTDPQLMFSAIGDVCDSAPLQVTQFESDIRIAEQLLDLWLEGRGGDAPEDYPLLWYFAAKHTVTDSFVKRKKKGYLFTIGDADCHECVQGNDIRQIFDDPGHTYSSAELLSMAKQTYEVFHIHIVKSSQYAPGTLSRLLPGHLICVSKDKINRLPEIMISVMQCVNGDKPEQVVKQWDELARPVVSAALESLDLSQKKKGIFF